MRYFLLFSLLILFIHKGTAQYNFVPNPSFENYSSLPDDLGEIYRALGWNAAVPDTTLNGLSEYYNLKANFFGNMPNTIFSRIYPEDSSGAAGFYVYDSIAGYREYINCKLRLPLHPNLDYRVSFYIGIGANYKSKYYCGTVGFGFSDAPLYESIPFSGLIYSPQVEIDTIFKDSLWHHFVFHFVPKSRYQFLTIGNFRSNGATSVVPNKKGVINGAYIFIDSISVIPKFYAFKDTTICRGEPVRLYAIGDNVFSWIDKKNPAVVLGRDSFLIVQPAQTTSYIVHGTGTNVDTVTVRVDIPPKINLGPDSVLCDTNKIRIGDTCLDCTYKWNNGVVSPYIQINQPGNYILTGTNVCNAATDSFYLSSVQKPEIPLSDTIFCQGDSIALNAFHKAATYLWSTGETTSSIVVHLAGTYSVTLNDSSCEYQYSAYVQSFPKPQLSIGNDTTICNGNTVTLKAKGDFSSVLWSDGSTKDSLQVFFAGIYSAMAFSSCGTVEDSLNVNFEDCPTINVPDAFTPNGDGINDKLIIQYPELNSFNLKIFNRWGQLIFSTSDASNFWDGTQNGSPAPMATYAYVIDAMSKEGLKINQQGMILLVR